MSIKDKISKYGASPTFHDLLKAIAGVTMVIDHVGLFFLGNDLLFRVIGRIAAPIFFFLIGFSEKRTLETRLLYAGALLTILYGLVFHEYRLNILIFFLLIRWLFQRWDPANTHPAILFIVFAALIPFYPEGELILEFAQIGFFWAIAGRLTASESYHRSWWLSLTMIGTLYWYIVQFELYNGHEFLLALLALQFLALALAFWSFQKKTFHLSRLFSAPIIFLSRLSFEIYVIHFGAFLLIALAFAEL